MRISKRNIVKVMVVILCVVYILHPLSLFTNAEESQTENIGEIKNESEVIQGSEAMTESDMAESEMADKKEEDENEREESENESSEKQYEGVAKDERKTEIGEGYFAENEDEMSAILHPEMSLFSYDGQTLYVSAGSYTSVYDVGFTNRYNVSGDGDTMHYAYCLQPDAPDPSGSGTVYEVDNFYIKLVICLGMYGPAQQYGFDAGIWPGVNEYNNGAKLPAAYGYVHATLGYLYGAGPGIGLYSEHVAQLDNWVQSCMDIYNNNPEVKKIVDHSKLFYMYGGYCQDVAWVEYVPSKNGRIEIYKYSENETVTADNSHYDLSGAVFGIYNSEQDEVGRLITDANGYAVSEELEAGAYTLKEITPSKGFDVNLESFGVTVNAEETSSVRVSEPLALGNIEIIKASSDKTITGNNDFYSLAGAVYGVYNSGGEEIGRIRTDENGWGQLADIPVGDYVIKEISAPQGFYVDLTSHNVTVIPGQSVTVNTEDVPKVESIEIILGKIDAETGSNKTSGSKSLEGALFEIKFYSVQMDTDPGSLGYVPEKQWILKTDEDGFCKLKDTYKMSGDDFYNDSFGNSLLPSGTITIQEIQPPEGYLINNEIFMRKIAPGDLKNVSTYNYPEIPEIPQKIQIELNKIDSENRNDMPQGNGELSGAEYEVRDLQNNIVDLLVTDDTGYAVSKELPIGVYKIKETVSSKGYLVDQTIYTVDASKPIDETSSVFRYKVTSGEDILRGDVEIIKFRDNLDENDENLTPLSGVEFTFTSKTTGNVAKVITTDEQGWASTASAGEPRGSLVFDTYMVTETKYPDNVKPIEPFEVTISEEGVTLKGIYKENKLISSPVTVVKKDKSTGNTILIAGVEFRLLDSEKNPISMTAYYPSNESIDTFATDENGQFYFPRQLEHGTYYLEEVNAPEGYLKGELLEFKVIEGAVWENPLVIEYFNEPVMGKIQIEKSDLETGDLLDNVTFDIVAAEDIITSDGTIRLGKGDVADTVVTKDGIAESKELFLGKYEIKEKKQSSGYVLSEDIYDVILEYKDQKTPIVFSEVKIKNTPTKVRILKTDAQTGKPLSDVKFKIWDKAEEGSEDGVKKPSEQVYVTDKEGIIEVGYLIPGTYCVQEIRSLYGYAPDDRIQEFVVTEDGRINDKEIEEITIINSPIDISTKAADKADGDKRISNREKETIVDKVSYKGLIPGKEYTLRGVLMVKSTGKPLENDGKDVTSELTFTPETEDGEIELSFTFNAKALAAEKIVAFEHLYYEEKEIVAHADIKDEEQTIEVVEIKIGTKAVNKADGEKEIIANGKITIVDTINYINLIPGQEYKLSGVLMDKKSGSRLFLKSGEVVAETIFIPSEADGTVAVEFTFDASELGGRDIVVFEKLFDSEENFLTAHEDINDKGQTIYFKKIPDTPKTGDGVHLEKIVSLGLVSAFIMILIWNSKRKKYKKGSRRKSASR